MNRVVWWKIANRCFLSAGSIALLTLMVPSAAPAQTAKISVTQRARGLAEAGKVEDAIRALQQELETDPSNLSARLLLADLYTKTKEDGRAEEQYREACRLHPESPDAALQFSSFYMGQGSFDEAELMLTDIVRRFPKLTRARMQYAVVLSAKHKYKEASANIRMIPPPQEPTARVRYFRLEASIRSGLGDAPGAASAIERALKVMPTDSQLARMAALTESQAGEWKACIDHLSPLFVKRPDPETGLLLLRAQLASDVDFSGTLDRLRGLSLPADEEFDLHVHSAELLSSANEHKDAAEEFQRAVRLFDGGANDTLIYNLAVEQYASRQYENAISTLKPLREKQDSADVEDLAGDAEARTGDLPAAIHSHETAVMLAPKEERYRLSLGSALLESGTYATAAEAFEQAAQLFPSSARTYVGLGMAYYFMERYEDSVAAFLRANELDPESGRAMAYLGATQADSVVGPSSVAVQAICKRANSNPNDLSSNIWCGALMFRRAYLAGDYAAAEEAIPRLQRANRLAARNPVASCSLGRALAWTHQTSEARHWMEVCVELRPDSTEDHYQLNRIYQKLGLKSAAAHQAKLIAKLSAEKVGEPSLAQKFSAEITATGPSSIAERK